MNPRLDLTARELQIMRLVAAGVANRDIAAEGHVQTETIKWHLTNVYRKLSVQSRAEATWRCLELGLIPSPAPARSQRVKCPWCDRRFEVVA